MFFIFLFLERNAERILGRQETAWICGEVSSRFGYHSWVGGVISVVDQSRPSLKALNC